MPNALKIHIGEREIELTGGDVAIEQMMSRAVVTDGKGALRIDGVDLSANEVPLVEAKLRSAADHVMVRAFSRAVGNIRDFTNKEEWTPRPVKPRKNIEIILAEVRQVDLEKLTGR